MNTNLSVSVCVYVIRRQQILTHILLYCVANLPTQQCRKEWKILVGSLRTKTCNLAAIVCNCNTFDEGPKVEISNKTTECWSTVTNFSCVRKIQSVKTVLE